MSILQRLNSSICCYLQFIRTVSCYPRWRKPVLVPITRGMLLICLFSTMAHAQTPVISSVSPGQADVGTSITITGSNFDPVSSNNTVYFGASQATVGTATSSQLVVTVPAGATYGPVTVIANGLATQSTPYFTVTHGGNAALNAETFLEAQNEDVGSGATISVLGDIDGDGVVDLVAIPSDNSSVIAYRNVSAETGSIGLSSQLVFAGHEQMQDITLADFDNDGKLDVAVCNLGSSTRQAKLSVLRNTSSGSGSISFASPEDFDIGISESLSALASADLDGDGKLDLVVNNLGDNKVLVFSNQSSGAGVIDFTHTANLLTGNDPHAIAITDIDGDKVADVIVAGRSPDQVSIFRNTSTTGSFSFDTRQDFALNGSMVSHVNAGDMDGDGLADIVVSHVSAQLSVFRNTSTIGNVSMASRLDYAAVSNRATLADLTGDGKVEMISFNLSDVNVYQNTSAMGSISYAAPKSYQVTGGFSLVTRSVGVADMDLDGEPDLVVPFIGFGYSAIGIFKNALSENDLLTFSFPEQTGAAAIDAANHTVDIEVANGTDITDLVATFTASSSASGVVVGSDSQVSGSTTNDFSNPLTYTVTAEDGQTQDWTVTVTEAAGFADVDFYSEHDLLGALADVSAEILDVDGDHFNDILVVQQNTSTLYKNNKDFTFTEVNNVFSLLPGSSTMALFDFNSDNRQDVILVGNGQDRVYLATGDGEFDHVDINNHPFTGVDLGAIGLIDGDGDGDMDVIISGGGNTRYYRKNGPSDYEEVATGMEGFDEPAMFSIPSVSVEVADINGDLVDDVVIAGTQSGSGAMKVYLGDGMGGFSEHTTSNLAGNAQIARVGDVDGDGDQDVAVIIDFSTSSVYKNDGNGVFTFFASLPIGLDLDMADFDTDGDMDIITSSFDPSGEPLTVLNLYDEKTDSFVTSGSEWLNVSRWTVEFGDLDQDFDDDLVIFGADAIFGGSAFSRVYRNGNNVEEADFELTRCGDFALDGVSYSSSGSYQQTITTFEGYSRDVNLDLTIWPTDSTLSIQEMVSYEFDGEILTETGTYEASYISSYGCDSLVTLELTILTSEETLNVYAVGEYEFDGTVLTSSGRYVYVYENQYGHDSTIYVNLTIDPDTYDSQDYLQFIQSEATFDSLYFGSSLLADLDGDGDLDLVQNGTDTQDAATATYHTQVYFNDGAGNFTKDAGAGLEASIAWPEGVMAADLDGDQDLDMVITGYNNVLDADIGALYINDGTGSFTEKTDANIPAVHRSAMDTADVDLDGDLDLLIAGYEGRVFLLINDGTATFAHAAGQPFSGGTYGSVNLGDVDGDGDPDAFIIGTASGGIESAALYLNDGSGDFTKSVSQSFTALTSATSNFSDFDQDGDLDLFLSGRATGASFAVEASFYWNDGSGNFTKDEQNDIAIMEVGDSEVADFDNDGDPDLLVGGRELFSNKRDLKLYLNNGWGHFRELTGCFDALRVPTFAIGDVNGDGRQDIFMNGQKGLGGNTIVSHLYLNELFSNDLEVAVCDSYQFDGVTLTSTGVYQGDTLAVNGCSYPVNLNLTILSDEVIEDISACEEYEFDGSVLTSSGTFNATFVNAEGCDSLVTLNLTILEPSSGEEEVEACESYEWEGTLYTASGTYQQILTNVAGCDSAATLDLTILEPSEGADTVQACDSYDWEGITYATTGTYEITLTNAAGCDSVATLDLTIFESTSGSDTVSACSSYSWEGLTLSSTGTYDTLLTSASGCDSLATLVLTVLEVSESSDTIVTCDSYEWAGLTLFSSGVYDTLLTSATGCDSLATLVLTISDSDSSFHDVAICDSFSWNGVNYTASGVYDTLLTNASGCDSLVTINLTILDGHQEEMTIDACGSYTFGSQVITESGVYEETFTNVQGCDSTVVLTLGMLPEPGDGITKNGQVLFAEDNSAGLAYQWIDCATGEALVGEDKRQLTPPTSGEYAVRISNGVCEVTTACLSTGGTVLSTRTETQDQLAVFPNPTSENLFLAFGQLQSSATVSLYTMEGKRVTSQTYQNTSEVVLQIEKPGLYLLKVLVEGWTEVETFTVLRR